MGKGMKMTIKVSMDVLEKMLQDDKNRPENLLFDEENDTHITQKNDSE